MAPSRLRVPRSTLRAAALLVGCIVLVSGPSTAALGTPSSAAAPGDEPTPVDTPAAEPEPSPEFSVDGELTQGGTTTSNPPVFTGTGTPGAAVAIDGAWGSQLGRTTVEPDSTWSITWNKVVMPGQYSGGHVTHNDGRTISTDQYDFTVVDTLGMPFTLGGGMTDGVTTTENPPLMSGTGTPGARIEVQGDWGSFLGRTTVEADGTWEVRWCRVVVNRRYNFTKVIQNDGSWRVQVIKPDFTLNDPTGGAKGDPSAPACQR
ncbi:hypothetical protein [Plantibacter sp. CFBP 13570]|uniref:hypothetical protein n=1 Tax=Plantibacter sp. CFBP 13570 TaxID=2775272 RepID=UPI001930DD76|nr:hypothetical protein [Plantibacter sp. CFBP 13570]MBD8533757.1 hypothetical protein [Plantibacter sp. CFBP 13570]